MAVPDKQTLQIISRLASNPQNLVYVISGRDRLSLEGCFGHLPIGLACEHGYFFRNIPKSTGEQSDWEEHSSEIDTSWRAVVLPILDEYTERTPGSFVEHKQINVCWHFRNSDADFASNQVKDLIIHLETAKLPVNILKGKKTIEIRPRGISKGAIVRKILVNHPDSEFVLCVGDDKTDEDMFQALDGYHLPTNCFTIMVADKPTSAKFYVDQQRDVIRLLSSLSLL